MNLLIIDDYEYKAQSILKSMVKNYNWNKITIKTTAIDSITEVENALQEENAYDVIFVDMQMPMRMGEQIATGAGVSVIDFLKNDLTMNHPDYNPKIILCSSGTDSKNLIEDFDVFFHLFDSSYVFLNLELENYLDLEKATGIIDTEFNSDFYGMALPIEHGILLTREGYLPEDRHIQNLMQKIEDGKMDIDSSFEIHNNWGSLNRSFLEIEESPKQEPPMGRSAKQHNQILGFNKKGKRSNFK